MMVRRTERVKPRARRARGVVRHAHNQGKGAALRTGFNVLLEAGADAAVCVDADGQHPPQEAALLARDPAARSALVLGVRESREGRGARRKRILESIFQSLLVVRGRPYAVRHPVRATPLPVAGNACPGRPRRGYGYEAELILRAARLGWEIRCA
ncbi:MAG: glycosyltransferase [Pseudomonadota bacterium]